MSKSIKSADWSTLRSLAVTGTSLSDLATQSGINLNTLKARSRREGWHRATREATAARAATEVAEGKLSRIATDGHQLATNTILDIGKRTRLNFAKTVEAASEHAASLDGKEALDQSRKLKDSVAAAATVLGWAQAGPESHNIINIALIGRDLKDVEQ